MKEDIVAKEVAELEMQRFIEKMDLDLEEKDMDDEDKKGYKIHKERIIKAICKGSLVIDEEGIPTYTPVRSENKNPITFHEPTGSTMIASDRKKDHEIYGKVYASLGQSTKNSPAIFNKMKSKDLNVCISIHTLFLAQ